MYGLSILLLVGFFPLKSSWTSELFILMEGIFWCLFVWFKKGDVFLILCLHQLSCFRQCCSLMWLALVLWFYQVLIHLIPYFPFFSLSEWARIGLF